MSLNGTPAIPEDKEIQMLIIDSEYNNSEKEK